MFKKEKLNATWRYSFNYHLDITILEYYLRNHRPDYYIDTLEDLSDEELKTLEEILVYFPHCHKRNRWPEKFAQFNPDAYSKKLLKLAANAFDYSGNTLLGVAAEWADPKSINRLIKMGADVNTVDHHMGKLALHWAVTNVHSFKDQNSLEAVKVVQCLLDHGARADIVCYEGKTVLQYAESRKYSAAVTLINNHINATIIKAATCGFFHDKLIDNVSCHLATFFNMNDAQQMVLANKKAWESVKKTGYLLKK
jgi:ankyrin repeat protein